MGFCDMFTSWGQMMSKMALCKHVCMLTRQEESDVTCAEWKIALSNIHNAQELLQFEHAHDSQKHCVA